MGTTNSRKKSDPFSACHPAVTFLYFMTVLLVTMFITHPVILALSFLGACAYDVCLSGWKKVLKFNLLFTLPWMIIVAFINPAFNHYGVTVLFYMKTGPVTLEAIVYGVVLASMLFIAILWFACFNIVMTTDKFVYLFGRVAPALSLVLSMVFRFVPRFAAQQKIISAGQKCIGRDTKNGNFFQRIRHGITILSILITWALENSIETSDSMQARGHGLPGRTSFSIFRFDRRDAVVTGAALIFFGVSCFGFSNGLVFAQYDPFIKIAGMSAAPLNIVTFTAWGIFCCFPALFNLIERIRWRYLSARMNEERNLPWYLTDPNEKPLREGRPVFKTGCANEICMVKE